MDSYSRPVRHSAVTPAELLVQIPARVKLAWAAGLGGLLLILLGFGFYAVQVLGRARTAESESMRLYLTRREALTNLGDALYVTGSHARDYLVDPDERHYISHSASTLKAWAQAQDGLKQYRNVESDSATLARLEAEVVGFGQLLHRSLELKGTERKLHGFSAFASELGPARDRLLGTIDSLATQDDGALRNSISEAAAYLAEIEVRLMQAIGVSLALGMLVAAFAYRYMVKLESEAAVRYQESVHARTELERLSHRLLAVQEEERKALARELHDGVGQALGAILMDLGRGKASLGTGQEESLARIESARDLAEAALHSVRDISLLLRPSMLDDLGLLPALHWQAREVSRRTGMLVTVESEEEDLNLDEELRTTVYRVTQEALQNAARHSGAPTTQVTIAASGGLLRIQVKDTGNGFDVRSTRGMGLLGMQERVTRYGGKLTITSSPGLGTTLDIELPIRTSEFGPLQHRHYENANFAGG